MTFDERLTCILVGMAIGGILGYFIRDLRDIRRTVHSVEDKLEKNEDGLLRKPLLLDMVLLLVVLAVVYAAVQSQAASNAIKDRVQRDLVERCEASVSTRIIQRDTVDAVYVLALGVTERSDESPELTEDQRQAYNRFIRRANAFRETMYAKIKPPDYCLPYVDDDKVEPPSPPYPEIPRSDVNAG